MKNKQGSTRRLTLAAVVSALGVVTLTLGAFVQVLDISMAVIASLFVVFGVIELRGPYPYLIYAVTALLSILLLPNKTPALIYLLFAGYYPILKAVFEGKCKKIVAWVLKFAVFNVVLWGVVALALAMFMSEIPAEWLQYWWALFLLEPVFLLYDIALTRLISVYILHWRPRLRFLN